MRNKGKDFFSSYFGKNGMSLWIAIFFLILGISIGAFAEKMMSVSQKNDLLMFVDSYFNVMHLENISKSQIFIQSLVNNYKILIIILLSGATVIGFPIALIALTFKGITVGFAAAFFMEEMKIKGLFITISSILPQNLVFVPVLVMAVSVALGFSSKILLRKGNTGNNKGYIYQLSTYLIVFMILGGIYFVGCLIETYISPALIKMIVSV
ncbi:MAG: stage II sporulation protein M [Clostridia bacterium]|nr:stage II sporulation protein M [Clostridia bacterium]